MTKRSPASPDGAAVIHEAPTVLSRRPLTAVTFLGLPLAVAVLFQSGFNLTEVWIFGSIGDQGASVAGAAASDVVTGLFALLANGLGNSAVAEISFAHGARDTLEKMRHARQALVIAAALSLVSVLVGVFAGPIGELIMADGETRERGTAFLRIMAIGGFGTIVLAFAIAVLRAVGDTMRPLIVVVVMSILTLLLEAAFVLGLFGLDPHTIEAAAWVTVIIRGLAAVTLLWMITRHIRLRPPPGERFVHLATLRVQLKKGATAAFQQSVRPLAFIALLALVAARFPGVGDEPSSAYTAVNIWIKLDAPTLMLAFAWGGGVAPVVGMALGAGLPRYARRSAWAGVLAAVITSFITMTLMLLFSGDLAALFIPDDPVAVTMTAVIYQYVAPVYACMTAGIVIANAFNGANDMATPLVWDFAILLAVQTALAFVWAVPGGHGLAGLGMALLVSGVLQGVIPALVLATARWPRRRRAGDAPRSGSVADSG